MAAGGHRGDHIAYPLALLPPEAKQKIADQLDGSYNKFSEFGYYFHYNIQKMEAIWNRGFNGKRNSATRHLLDLIEERGGTVQDVYEVFHRMNHCAVHIIQDYFPVVQAEYQRWAQEQYYARGGQQNSCSCHSCARPGLTRQSSEQPRSVQNPRGYNRQSSVPERQEYYRNQWEPPESTNITATPNHVYYNDQNTDRYYSRQSESRSENLSQSQNQSQNQHEGESLSEDRQPICNCEQCHRLRSDPNETQLLTCYKTNKEDECLLQGMDAINISAEHQHTDRSQCHPNNTPGQSNGARPKTYPGSDKVCANSKDGVHYVGQRPDTCRVCKSCVERREFRHSWHGNNDVEHESTVDSQHNLSDSSLYLHQRSQNGEVVYSRLNNLHSVDIIPPASDSDNALNNIQNIPNTQPVNNCTSDNTVVQSGQPNNNNGNVNNNNSHRNNDIEISNDISNNNINHGARLEASSRRNTTTTIIDGVDKKPVVLITYCPHSNSHLAEIKKLIRLLQQAGIRVKIDMDPDSFSELGLNRNEWLDRAVDNADYVIICISPTYSSDIKEPQNSNHVSPRISQLNARYIFDRLRTEYINNQSRNRRMIPVLFPNSGATLTSVPYMMQATLVYTFPSQIQDIINRIFGRVTSLPYE